MPPLGVAQQVMERMWIHLCVSLTVQDGQGEFQRFQQGIARFSPIGSLLSF